MSVLSCKNILFAGILVLVMGNGPVPALGQDTPPDTDPASVENEGSSSQENRETTPPVGEAGQDQAVEAKDPAASKDDSFQQAIEKLQKQLDAQNKQIEALKAQYASEVTARQKEIDNQDKQINEQKKEIAAQREAIQSLQQEVDQARIEAGQDISESEKALRSRLETVEQSIKKSEESESTAYDIDSFPGSFPIPGSSAAIKFAGFVKMNYVQSFDPIGTNDRFIVGSIPVPEVDGPNEAALTVSRSRLSIEMRDTTQYGPVRAFLEADFAGSGDTFRLRHAFGQYKSFLIGKTWSTFMDTRARPEDLDSEGINGQIFRRQAQIRYFPKIGQDWHLLLSAEDPSATILNGAGVSQFPDLVASVEREILERWHVKSSLLYRRIYGECDCLDNKSDTVHGWAVSVSGMTGVKRWDERDNMQIQLSYGEGYSRYINDLGSIGAPDALFDPSTGQLSAVPAFSMYAAFQKWWTPNMRSSFIYGYVNVENKYRDLNPEIYNNTSRFSANFIWSPISRIDLGAEVLYGTRSNQDGESAKARQVQLSAKYRY